MTLILKMLGTLSQNILRDVFMTIKQILPMCFSTGNTKIYFNGLSQLVSELRLVYIKLVLVGLFWGMEG